MVEVRNLVKRYGDKTAIDDISFTAGSGQVVGLLGLNGAGKSTTLNILTGYINATSGTVTIGGYDMQAEANKAKSLIGYLPELLAFYPEMKVDEHLDFICGLKGIGKKGRRQHIDSICDRVGIADVKKRMLRNLSKGYRQRVGFAQALVGNPAVVILDEPTAGLDPSQIIEMRKCIKDCGKESTVVVSSHILSEIQAICDRVIIIDKGKLVADDAPEVLVRKAASSLPVCVKGDPKSAVSVLGGVKGVNQVKHLGEDRPGIHNYVVYCEPGLDAREEMFYALAEAMMPIYLPYGSGSSLEDVFLKLVNSV